MMGSKEFNQNKIGILKINNNNNNYNNNDDEDPTYSALTGDNN